MRVIFGPGGRFCVRPYKWFRLPITIMFSKRLFTKSVNKILRDICFNCMKFLQKWRNIYLIYQHLSFYVQDIFDTNFRFSWSFMVKILFGSTQYAEKTLNRTVKYINKTYAGWKSIYQRLIKHFSWILRSKNLCSLADTVHVGEIG